MNHLILKSDTSVAVGSKPMVILPLDMYEKLTRNSYETSFEKAKKGTRKSKRDFFLITSESSLSKDWLKPVEEKAWQNL